MPVPLETWHRGPRTSITLSTEKGVYALFLREGANLPGVVPGPFGLTYIGLAANRKGLLGRCHFAGRTRNHSPRKSLAALLIHQLGLIPILIPKPNSPDTWGLDAPSEQRLSDWMLANLELAVEPCEDPDARESELVSQFAPPLNLTKCEQTPQHRMIAGARRGILAKLQGAAGGFAGPSDVLRSNGIGQPVPMPPSDRSRALRRPIGSEIDTAEAIALRYGLSAKSYRLRLRGSISWYRKPQDWTFRVGSREWQDMIEVAEMMDARG